LVVATKIEEKKIEFGFSVLPEPPAEVEIFTVPEKARDRWVLLASFNRS
jgi:hypothetical protein